MTRLEIQHAGNSYKAVVKTTGADEKNQEVHPIKIVLRVEAGEQKYYHRQAEEENTKNERGKLHL